MKVSIVVPVYNVYKYLDKCLDSLVNQTLQDIEIIVVNDGSPDNSQEIIDEYVNKYPNKVIGVSKPNGGLSSARNFGLDYCKGEYIGFIDSDDWVEPTMYEKMYEKAITDNADMVTCDFEWVWEDHSKPSFVQLGWDDNIEGTDIQKSLMAPPCAWNKLYRKGLFMDTNIRYPEGLWYEDIPTTFKLILECKKISYVHETFVHYLQRPTSIMGTSYNPKMHDIFKVYEIVRNYYKEKGVYNKYYAELEYLHVEHFILYGNYRFIKTTDFYENVIKSINLVNKEFPKWRSNKYISRIRKKDQIFIYTINRFTIHFYHWYLT